MNSKEIKHHFHTELVEDVKSGNISDSIMLKWFNDRYSTSKHLLSLYSIIRGLDAKNILEIGFGRSTFVILKATIENNAFLTSCDMENFSYLLPDDQKKYFQFCHSQSNEIWRNDKIYDFAFLDYFSSSSLTTIFCYKEIKHCIRKMKQNGIIAIHDTYDNKYAIKKALALIKLTSNIEYVSLPYNYGLGLIRIKGNKHNGALEEKFLKKQES